MLIFKEAMNNALKYAQAKKIELLLKENGEDIWTIILRDDGKGFDIKKVDVNNGMGISSIKTRVKHLKGTFTIDATIGKGSSIIMDIPTS